MGIFICDNVSRHCCAFYKVEVHRLEPLNLSNSEMTLWLDVDTPRWPNVGLMLGQRLWRWPNITPSLGEYLVCIMWRVEAVGWAVTEYDSICHREHTAHRSHKTFPQISGSLWIFALLYPVPTPRPLTPAPHDHDPTLRPFISPGVQQNSCGSLFWITDKERKTPVMVTRF